MKQNPKEKVAERGILLGFAAAFALAAIGASVILPQNKAAIVLLAFAVLAFLTGVVFSIQKAGNTHRIRTDLWFDAALIIVIVSGIAVISSAWRDMGIAGQAVLSQKVPAAVKTEPTVPPSLSIPEPTVSPITDMTMRPGIVDAGFHFTVALKSDGTVISLGGENIYTGGWEGVRQIAAYGNHVVGLCSNGTVVFTGKNVSGESNTAGWSNVVQVAACYEGTIGLTNDGRVLYSGYNMNNQSACTSWTDIKLLLGGEDHIAGLTEDGCVVTSGYKTSEDNRHDVADLRNVIGGDVASGTTFCIFSDGSVTARGRNWVGEDNIGGWTNIVAISGGDEHTVGLRADGTVIAVGSNAYGQCEVNSWTDIVAICAGQYHTVGVKADGTLVATGNNDYGQCNVAGIKLW